MNLNIYNDDDDIYDLSLYLIDIITQDYPMIYNNSNYKDIIYEEIELLLDIQFENLLFDNIELNNIYDIIINSIDYYSKYIYCRSHEISVILNKPNINLIKKKINYLNSVYQPEQRTVEWYEFRHKYLTASSIWKVFNTENSRKDLLINKCTPIDINKYNSVNLYSPLHHGQKYEYLSVKWYENYYNTIISEFGCIPHKDVKYIAASPDGINTDPKSNRYGRMLEIKNIFNREINGIPKKEYWIQMQIQMEVCNLNECDFLETRFIEYDNYSDFTKDGSFNLTYDKKQKGIIILFTNSNGVPIYEYSPWDIDRKEYLVWEEQILNKNKGLNWFKNIYWKLDEISCVLVERNKNWFEKSNIVLLDFWRELKNLKKNKELLDNLLNSKISKKKQYIDNEIIIDIDELIDIEYKLIYEE